MYKLVVVALAASAAASAASRHSRDIKNHDHDAANLVAKSDDKELELSVSLGHLRGTVSALSDLAAAENHRGLQGKGNGKGRVKGTVRLQVRVQVRVMVGRRRGRGRGRGRIRRKGKEEEG